MERSPRVNHPVEKGTDIAVEGRLDYGFNGDRVPRAARSYRGRGRIRNKGETGHIRSFEILASVAGKLLQDGKDSVPFQAPCTEDHCHGVKGYPLHEFLPSRESSNSSHVDNVENGKMSSSALSSKLDGLSPKEWELCQGQVESLTETETEAGCIVKTAESGTSPLEAFFEDKMDLDINEPVRASPDNNTRPSLYKNCIGLDCFSGRSAETKVVSRDDDDIENVSGCSDHLQSCNGAGKKSKTASNSKVGRVLRNGNQNVQMMFIDGKTSNCATYHNAGISCSNQQKPQKIVPFKKRKFFACDDGGSVCEDLSSNSPNKRTNDDSCGSASRTSSSVSDQHTPPNSRDSNGTNISCEANFISISGSSLASNRSVPELSIEIPPNATVGSLKRMVMEAVSAILCNGLRVAIFVQGKWVRDDNKTVLQAGICQDDKNHSCGFMLEPRYSHVASPSSAESRSFLSSRSAGGQSRHASPRLRVGSSSSSTVASEIDEHIRVFPLADGSTDRASSPDSKALVRVPAIRMESLAIVPFQQKSGQQELGQRRVRRPFSVSEVEALVQAVEKLGTGRWRDVKLRAFDYVNHRTHVDLKDKWKTLVHTARISPQQRRGEPVPQQLLDRVLAAHAYWSQQQSTRQQPKSTA
ncbi:Telomere repeat-binding protein 5 [Linum perenne]